tara:strand:- start:21 stop:668 length:648 start_codon:yes stop_codon:yes gene_type:complete
MGNYLDAVFTGANAIPTGLLLFIILYWIIVILGLVGTDFLDFDIDVDSELDLDSDIEGSSETGISWLNKALVFFNLGRIPLMIWLSFLSLPLWIMTMILNQSLGFSSFIPGLLTLIPSLLLSLFLAKFFTWPLVKVFDRINEETKEKDVLGRIGKVILSASHTSKGQAEANYNGTFLSFYILTEEGIEVSKGSEVIFIKPLDGTTFIVEPHLHIK